MVSSCSQCHGFNADPNTRQVKIISSLYGAVVLAYLPVSAHFVHILKWQGKMNCWVYMTHTITFLQIFLFIFNICLLMQVF